MSLQVTVSVGAFLSFPGSEGESLALTAGIVESLHLDINVKGINLPVSLHGLDCSILLSFKKFGKKKKKINSYLFPCQHNPKKTHIWQEWWTE